MENMKLFSICDTDELQPGERLFIEIEGLPIVLFNIDGNLFAISDTCTHADGSLGEGDLEGHEIVCPRHGARFDVRTGEVLALPAIVDVETYPVSVEDGKIKIGIAK